MGSCDSGENMKNEGLVSIIVPVYKVEQYLNRCVSSLCSQTYTNLELILVDDGSPDRCGRMCDEWAKKEPRIQVIHKSNGGLSDARNAGIRIASGEYIAFVDSDDWVSPIFVECLCREMRHSDCDIIECEVFRTKEEGADFPAESGKGIAYAAEAALEELIRDGVFHQYVWNKMYRRGLLDGIWFEKGKTNEDEFWTYQIFGRAKRIVKLNAPLYCYYQRPDSIMGAQYSIKRLDALEAKCRRQRYIDLKFPKLSGLAGLNLYSSCIYSGQMTLKFLKGNEKDEAMKIIDRIQRENRPDPSVRKSSSGTEKLWVAMACLNFWGTCRLKNLLRKGF